MSARCRCGETRVAIRCECGTSACLDCIKIARSKDDGYDSTLCPGCNAQWIEETNASNEIRNDYRDA